ncbi:MAG: DUF11 domain-containing protein, partial [Xanthomonadales bacterium]|nr:DUF11 domain-containing protein [Xanthomonadales bacterium]
AATAAETARYRVLPGGEAANKGRDVYSRVDAPTATVNYSDTIAAAPTFNRPFGCGALSGAGTAVGYHVQQFSVDTGGSYSIEVLGTSTLSDDDSYLVIYQTAFDPMSPLTNCVITDDDSGTGYYSLATAALTAGTQYFAVTTTYANGTTGPFDNQISGPGNITLGGGGPQADLGVTVAAPSGVATGGTFTYTLTATNNGPDPATGVLVTDVLSPSVTFVSSDCGATARAGTVVWNIGAMANGASATCTITVSMGAVCAVVDNVDSIDGVEGDPGAGNNSSAISNSAGNIVLDPGFEGGTPNATWTEASTNFGTPICDAGTCGVGSGTGPRSGTFWSWFGGYGAGAEAGSVQQAMVIPTGSTTLDFWVEFPVCNAANGVSDYVRVLVDGSELWRENATSARCGVIGYQQVSVDISAYDDGLSHTVTFDSTTVGGGAVSNFFVDDVSIAAAPVCVAGFVPKVPVPAFDRGGLALLTLLLGMLGIAAARRNPA